MEKQVLKFNSSKNKLEVLNHELCKIKENIRKEKLVLQGNCLHKNTIKIDVSDSFDFNDHAQGNRMVCKDCKKEWKI